MKHDADIGWIREALMGASRLAFGKQYRLEIAAVVRVVDPPIWSRRLAKALDIPENQVASELGHFVEMEALQRFPAPHDRRKLYQLLPHPLWSYASDLFELTVHSARPDDGVEQLTWYWDSLLERVASEPVPESES